MDICIVHSVSNEMNQGPIVARWAAYGILIVEQLVKR